MKQSFAITDWEEWKYQKEVYTCSLENYCSKKNPEKFDSLPRDFIETRRHRWYFPKNIPFFTREAISQNRSKSLIVKDVYLLEISNKYCFRRPNGNCRKSSRRNITTVLRAVVKSHKGPKGTEVITHRYSRRNLKYFSIFTEKNPCLSPFIVNLLPKTLLRNS